MEPLQQIQINNQLAWLVEGHTLSEGALFEVFHAGEWRRVRHIGGQLLTQDGQPLPFTAMGQPARLLNRRRFLESGICEHERYLSLCPECSDLA